MLNLPALAQNEPVNLLANPDFELGLNGSGIPMHWQNFARSDAAYYELTDEAVSTGSKAVRLVDTADNESTGLRTEYVPAQLGHTYEVQVDALVRSGLGQLYLDFRDDKGTRIVAVRELVRVTADWQTVVFSGTAPEGTATVSIILYSDIVNVGELLFSNVRLYDVTARSATTPERPSSTSYVAAGISPMPADGLIEPVEITVAEWQAQPPALYKPLPVHPGPDDVSTGPLHVAFSRDGLPTTMHFSRAGSADTANGQRLVTDVAFRITTQDNKPEQLTYAADASGYEVNNSYFTRRLARFTGAPDDSARLDVYTELVADSNFFYMFPRLHMQPGETTALSTSFQLEGAYRRVTYFDGDQRIQKQLTEPVSFVLDDTVTKPFIFLENAPGQAGWTLFFPVPPEVRAWYHEHYVPVARPAVTVTLEPTSDSVNITFQTDQLTASADRPQTFDFYYWGFPIVSAPNLAAYVLPGGIGANVWAPLRVFGQAEAKGLWDDNISNAAPMRMYQALRYYPEEGYSFATPEHYYKGLFTTMPEHARVWGNQTANYKRLGFSHSFAALGLEYDLAVRHLQLYLDKADETGIPPYRATAATWFKHFVGLSNLDLLGNFHFAQAPEYMVRTALSFIESGKPSAHDAQAIADAINRMQHLFDPQTNDAVPVAVAMPDGSFWYNYFEMETQQVHDGVADEPGFVNNTHLTWLKAIADAARLNKAVGNDDAHEEWVYYFRQGVDGLLYVLQQDRAWADHDPNELKYGINWTGPNPDYARYVLSDWLPRVMEFAYEEADGYRLPELVDVYRKVMKGRWAQRPDYISFYNMAVDWLAKHEYANEAN